MIRLDQICTCDKPDPYELGDLLSVTVCLDCGGRCENRLPDSPPPLASRRVLPLGGRFSERPSPGSGLYPEALLTPNEGIGIIAEALCREFDKRAERLEKLVEHLRERPRLEVVE